MKKNTIPRLHRAIASGLLTTQLLTSCGGHGPILPIQAKPPKAPVGISDDKPIAIPSIAYPPRLAPGSDREQGYASDDRDHSYTFFPTYSTPEGHKIQLRENKEGYVAKVTENTPPGFKRSLPLLPVRFQQGFYPEDLRPDSYMSVVFPKPVNGNKGYVAFARHAGLLGGGYICVDDEELKYAISEGYRMLVGREAETLHDWAPFIGSFVGGLSRIDLSLQSISYPSSFDPGNTCATFSRMASQITGRNIHLTNYGEAWTRIVNQARSRIEGERTLPLDPSAYPTTSYEIQLRPNAGSMGSLIGEMDRRNG